MVENNKEFLSLSEAQKLVPSMSFGEFTKWVGGNMAHAKIVEGGNVLLEKEYFYDEFNIKRIVDVLNVQEKSAEIIKTEDNNSDYFEQEKKKIEEYKKDYREKIDAELLDKVNQLEELEMKVAMLKPIYENMKEELTKWQILVNRRIQEYTVKQNKHSWYKKAKVYLESLNRKIGEAIG